jgi:hypothetical protein
MSARATVLVLLALVAVACMLLVPSAFNPRCFSLSLVVLHVTTVIRHRY